MTQSFPTYFRRGIVTLPSSPASPGDGAGNITSRHYSLPSSLVTLPSSPLPPGDETDQGDGAGNITSLLTDDAANLTELICQANYIWAIPLKVSIGVT